MRFIIPSLAAVAILSNVQGCGKKTKKTKKDNEIKKEKETEKEKEEKKKTQETNVDSSASFRNSNDDFKDSPEILAQRRRQADHLSHNLRENISIAKHDLEKAVTNSKTALMKTALTSVELNAMIAEWNTTLSKLKITKEEWKNDPVKAEAKSQILNRSRLQLLIRTVFFTLDAAASCRKLDNSLEPEFKHNMQRLTDLLKEGKQSVLRYMQNVEGSTAQTESSKKLEEFWDPLLEGASSYLEKSTAYTNDKAEISKLYKRNNQRVSLCTLMEDFLTVSESHFVKVLQTDNVNHTGAKNEKDALTLNL